MVRLTFTEYAPAPLAQVWEYFSKFQNTSDWQPNTKKITPKTSSREQVGSKYTLVSMFNGSEATLDYQILEIEKFKKLRAHGINSTTQVFDQILFKEKGPGTEIVYNADISLRHILKVITPCIKSDLYRLQEQAQNGMKQKIKQLWG